MTSAMADGGTVRIDGKAAAAEVLAELKVAVAELRATAGIVRAVLFAPVCTVVLWARVSVPCCLAPVREMGGN